MRWGFSSDNKIIDSCYTMSLGSHHVSLAEQCQCYSEIILLCRLYVCNALHCRSVDYQSMNGWCKLVVTRLERFWWLDMYVFHYQGRCRTKRKVSNMSAIALHSIRLHCNALLISCSGLIQHQARYLSGWAWQYWVLMLIWW